MLLVSPVTTNPEADRKAIDRKARRIVLAAYLRARAQQGERDHAFDRALASYRKTFPHVPKELAGHAVAFILADSGF